MSILDHKIDVTRFGSQYASTSQVERGSLRQIAAIVSRTTAPSKPALPWIKLALFGDNLSPKGAIRHNGNMLSVSGVEGDYDLGEMSPEEAADKLRKAKLAALIYTSPSHGLPGKGHRWRLLCPLAEVAEVRERRRLLARVNGVLGGVLSNESWTDSQAYYYGNIIGNPPVRTILVDGDALDTRLDLDATAVGKPRIEITLPAGENRVNLDHIGTTSEARRHLASAVSMFTGVDPEGVHQVVLNATQHVAQDVGNGVLDREDAVEAIRMAATEALQGRDDSRVGYAMGEEVPDALDRAIDKWLPPLREDEPLLDGSEFDFTIEEDTSGDHWLGSNPYGSVRWLIQGVLPLTGIGLISGQWAAGKTFLGLDMAGCLLTGQPFAGFEVAERVGVLWLAAEGAPEVPVRMAAVAHKRGFQQEGSLFVWRDTLPALTAPKAAEQVAEDAKRVADKMQRRGGRLGVIIIDTMATAAGWTDENDNAEAQHVMNVMRTVSARTDTLVLAVDHYGKTSDGGTRGASAKEAAADVVLAVLGEKQPDGSVQNRRMALRKVRAGASGSVHPFKLDGATVQITGTDESTCVVNWDVALPTKATPDRGIKPAHQQWLDVLTRLGPAGATSDGWWEAGQAEGSVSPSDVTFRGAKSALLRIGAIELEGEDFRVPFSLDDLMK